MKKADKKLILTGTCLNTKNVEYFSYKTHPEMKLIDAIRITVSIPLIYNKVEFIESKITKIKNY